MLMWYEMGKQVLKNRWMPRDVSSSWKNKLGMGAWSLRIAENKQTNKQTNALNDHKREVNVFQRESFITFLIIG